MLTPSQRYEQLPSASDANVMQPLLEVGLSRIRNRRERLKEFFVPRVIPGENGRLLIQYCFSVATGLSSEDRVLFGHLLAHDEEVPELACNPEVVFFPHLRLFVPVFPFDPKLKILGRLLDGGVSSEFRPPVPESIDQDSPLKKVHIKTLGYRPGRRATLGVRVSLPGRSESVIARIGRPEKVDWQFAALQRLEEAGFHGGATDRITVPHPIESLKQGLLWSEAIPDPSLNDQLASPGFLSGCVAAARTLNKLHRAHVTGLPAYTVEHERQLLRRAVLRLSAVYPQVGQQLEEVRSWVERESPAQETVKPATIHRDFYDKQILIGSSRISLLDIDTLASGDPAIDVGNFLAHLSLRARQTPALADGIVAGRQAFLETYENDCPSFWCRVQWWETAALLRLVCVYFLRPSWQAMANLILLGLVDQAQSDPTNMDSRLV